MGSGSGTAASILGPAELIASGPQEARRAAQAASHALVAHEAIDAAEVLVDLRRQVVGGAEQPGAPHDVGRALDHERGVQRLGRGGCRR